MAPMMQQLHGCIALIVSLMLLLLLLVGGIHQNRVEHVCSNRLLMRNVLLLCVLVTRACVQRRRLAIEWLL